VKKLRFAPGKGNSKMAVLYNTRIDIRDAVGVGQHKPIVVMKKWPASFWYFWNAVAHIVVAIELVGL